MTEKRVRCIPCGALVPAIDGPTHAYMLSSPGCWRLYGEVLAHEYGEYGMPSVHQLSVDAYAVQHPGVPERRSRQSVAVHLISLCLMLQCGMPPERAAAIMRSFTHREFPWLEPQPSAYDVTVVDVWAARNLEDHVAAVQRWAGAAWEAWNVHHDTVHAWLASIS